MAITEESRHLLYQRLESTLGREEATVLMEHLPPVGWADVATKTDLAHLKSDIDHLETALRKDIEAMGKDMEAMELRLQAEMSEKFSRLLFQLLASQVALVSLILVISRVA